MGKAVRNASKDSLISHYAKTVRVEKLLDFIKQWILQENFSEPSLYFVFSIFITRVKNRQKRTLKKYYL